MRGLRRVPPRLSRRRHLPRGQRAGRVEELYPGERAVLRRPSGGVRGRVGRPLCSQRGARAAFIDASRREVANMAETFVCGRCGNSLPLHRMKELFVWESKTRERLEVCPACLDKALAEGRTHGMVGLRKK